MNEYLLYVHDFLYSKKDKRSESIRDYLYKSHDLEKNTISKVKLINVFDRLHTIYSETYPELLKYDQWNRDQKINMIIQ